MNEPPVQVLGDGRERMAHGQRLAAAGDAVDQALSRRAGSGCRRSRSSPASVDEVQAPDAFVQMPPTQTNRRSQKLRYLTEPLPRRRADRRPDRAQPVRRDRPGRHQLDRHPEGRRPGRVGADRARGRARGADGPARARDDARLAQGLASRARSEALKAVAAVASADARSAEAGRARRDQRIRDRDHGDRQPVPQAVTASASRSPASTCRPASPARPTSSTFRTTSAAARRCCTRSITIAQRPSHLLLPVIPGG